MPRNPGHLFLSPVYFNYLITVIVPLFLTE